VGHVELDALWEGTIARRSYDTDSLFQAKARFGLFPHIELGVAEDVTWDIDGRHMRDADALPDERRGNHLRQEGNEISCRFAFWDYGTIPLNPSFEVTWHPRHGAAVDDWEGRASVGTELFTNFMLAANGFFRGQTGGEHDYTWGFTGGAAYELVPHVLRLGAEGGVTWQFSPDHKNGFAHTDPELGPTAIFRPLALAKPAWGNLCKITTSVQFGLRDDYLQVPFMRIVVLVGCQF
jgi:hypothetical protein